MKRNLFLLISSLTILTSNAMAFEQEASECQFSQLSQTVIQQAEMGKNVGCSATYNELVKSGQFAYHFEMVENGSFNLNMKTHFGEAKSAKEVFNKYLLNSQALMSVDKKKLMKGPPEIILPDSTSKKGAQVKVDDIMQGKSSSEYVSRVHGTFILNSKCQLIEIKDGYQQKCVIQRDSFGSKLAFDSDEEASTTTTCVKVQSGVKCDIKMKGKPNLGKTIGGATESLKNTFRIALKDNTDSACDGSEFEGTNLWKFYEAAKASPHDDFSITSNREGGRGLKKK